MSDEPGAKVLVLSKQAKWIRGNFWVVKEFSRRKG